MFMQRFKNTSNMQIFNSFYFKHLKIKKPGTVHGAYFKVPMVHLTALLRNNAIFISKAEV